MAKKIKAKDLFVFKANSPVLIIDRDHRFA